MLEGRSIVKHFNGSKVLQGVDISIKPGRLSVLIGPSGSGKTTLVRALSLIDPPTSGVVTFNGTEYSYPFHCNRKIEPPWPRITVVFQQHFLWPHLTLRDNISLPLKHRSDSAQSIESLINVFAMHDFIDRYPNEVSIGQRQRAAMARAFALNPQYVLLDEITSALDIEQTGVLIGQLLRWRDRGIGLLVVTHLIDFARQLVSRDEGDVIYLLDKGLIVESGGSAFFSNPKSDRARQFLSSIDYWRRNNGRNSD